MPDTYPLVWTWHTRPLDAWEPRSCRRIGQRCRVLVEGAKYTALVEFDDGYRTTTDRRGARLADSRPRQVPLL